MKPIPEMTDREIADELREALAKLDDLLYRMRELEVEYSRRLDSRTR